MKNTEYYQSGRHKENALAARSCALDAIRSLKAERIRLYDVAPNYCTNCDKPLPYEHRKNRFCNKSCAGSYNNSLRPAGSPSRMAQSIKIAGKKKSRSMKGIRTSNVCKISWHTCEACSKLFYTRTWSASRKTCGEPECITHRKVGHRPYTNGRRKLFTYHNKWQNVDVLLESSWEYDLAQWLDMKAIEWTRPSPIRWHDPISNKQRLYYPDFWLPALDLYLDPKNPTAMIKDKDKMLIVSGLIDIVYGELQHIKLRVDNLLANM